MEKSDAIRRAVRQSPAPEPPADFTARLMERMRREAARRARRETRLLAICGVGCFAALIDACWRLFFRPMGFVLQIPAVELPRITFPGKDEPLLLMCTGIALISLALLLADLLIRRRIASASRK